MATRDPVVFTERPGVAAAVSLVVAGVINRIELEPEHAGEVRRLLLVRAPQPRPPHRPHRVGMGVGEEHLGGRRARPAGHHLGRRPAGHHLVAAEEEEGGLKGQQQQDLCRTSPDHLHAHHAGRQAGPRPHPA
eukprot:tig00000681_g3135.t1